MPPLTLVNNNVLLSYMPRKPKNDTGGYLFIVDYFVRYGKQPSFQAIADKLGYASKRSVQLLLERLAAADRIIYAGGKIEIVHKSAITGGERTVLVPVLGKISCGGLAFADENIEGYVNVSTALARPGSNYFILRAKGISMDLSGIDDGDLVLVRKQARADQGQKVVALVGEEATIKHFYTDKGCVVLKPSSSDKTIRPIILSEEFNVLGVVLQIVPDPF